MRPALIALAAAAVAAGPALAADEAAGGPDANLFVYRDAASPATCAAELLLDGKPFARLAQHSYTSLNVVPGIHQLELRWAGDCGHGDVTNQLDVGDRRLYYYAVAGETRVTWLSPSTLNLHETTSLVPVDPDEGVQTVGACCRFVPASLGER